MSITMMIMTLLVMKSNNPIYMAMNILFLSIFLAIFMYKFMKTSWLSIVLVITFSSGMMTLFMYASSLVPTMKKNQKKQKVIPMLMVMLTLSGPMLTSHKNSQTMKMFSSQTVMMIMTTMLILTLIAVSSQGHHPLQTMSTSF